ncbi:MAG: AAA family ATPase, partial [Campylobacterota bacterium]|nr:AAA family ATPase [Campylobacterota bacterium]
SQRIVEINEKTDESATIETELSGGINIPSLFKLITKTKAKLSASQDTKDTIRRVFTNKFSEFSTKFNQFILNIRETIKEINIKDLLFIVDGFEKIGTLEDRKKILIDNSNKFVEIQSNMIIALPIELFSQVATLSNFSTPISFPLITLDEKGMNKFKEFIFKRVDESLFKDEQTIEDIIKYGAGSPRETLKVIEEAYIMAEEEYIDQDSVLKAKEKISNEIVNYLKADELEVLKELENKTMVYSDTLATLYMKKIIVEYGDGVKKISPIVSSNKTFRKLLNITEKQRSTNKIDIPKEKVTLIDNIKIENFFSIKNIELQELKEKKEIYIVGENGDGKTLLLQAIVLSLKGIEEGRVIDFLKDTDDEFSLKIEDSLQNSFDPRSKKYYRNILAYGAHRNNNCKTEDDETGYMTLFDNSIDLKDPKKWLIDLYNAEKSNELNIMSVESAKELLSDLLNSDIKIDITYNNVTFCEKDSPVSFEQLSAGYKGVITIIGDILVRLSENQPYVQNKEEFEGIVLIDEVELHLHPKWKYEFMNKLRISFPNIQFIVTTHSPTVILGASEEAVFYKVYKKDGKVRISNQIKNNGYTNNTLISSPLFDLETMASRNYDDKNFSDDDFIYEKIHSEVAKRIKNDIDITDEELSKLIQVELEKL